METMHTRARLPRKKQKSKAKRLFFIVLGVLMILAGKYVYDHYIPSFEQVERLYSVDNPIILNGEPADYHALVEGEQVKLPLPLLEDWLEEGQYIHYEESTDTLVITSPTEVLRIVMGEKAGQLQFSPYSLEEAAEKADGIVYIPTKPLEQLFGIEVDYNVVSGIVSLFHAGQSIQHGNVSKSKGAVLRVEPHIKSPYIMKLVADEDVSIWAEEAGWYKVQTKLGHSGFVKQGELQLTTTEQIPTVEQEAAFVAWHKPDQKINLVWDAIYAKRPDPAKITPMPGVNVISPTWFELADSDGNIAEKADAAYVSWAREHNYEVWALFSNAFDPEQTTITLANTTSRFNMIKQIVTLAEKYKLQGINIDFENVHTKDKENFVQFIRELTPLLHAQDVVVSIDVTPKSNSEMWSAFLDRESLGKIVDYMMVMAYDEHWAASPKSGSVASLSWTERAIVKIIEEDDVPPEKLILSMPLYTRIWTETTLEDGAVKVSSKAVGMEHVKNIVQEKQLTPELDEEAGQHYIEYMEEEERKRIWIEDTTSIAKRIEIVHKYQLAGVASWQRAFQAADIWPVIDQQLQQKSK